MHYLTRHFPALRVAGLKIRTDNSQAGTTIAGLWQRFIEEGVSERLAPLAEDEFLYAVYINYESDHHGAYDYYIGRAVAEGMPLPEGLESATLPAGDFHAFNAKGMMPQAVVGCWRFIWEQHQTLNRRFAGDVEVYDPRQFRPGQPGEVILRLATHDAGN